MTRFDRTPERCSTPTARRYPRCGCWACRAAYSAAQRTKRRAVATGEHTCNACGHPFQTPQGLATHRGRMHKGVLTLRGAA